MTWVKVHLTAFLSMLLVAGGTAQAAKLTLTDSSKSYKKWENGELIYEGAYPDKGATQRALPDAAEPVSASSRASYEAGECVSVDGCGAGSGGASSSNFIIEPEDGEEIGDSVRFCAEWRGDISATADANSSAAAASGGGQGFGFGVPVPTPSAEASTTEPAFVKVTNGPSYFLGDLDEEAPPSDNNSGIQMLDLHLNIGDEITISVAAAAAVATAPGASASASASGRLELYQGRCPVEPVPTTNAWGIMFIAMVLAMLGLLGFRRRV